MKARILIIAVLLAGPGFGWADGPGWYRGGAGYNPLTGGYSEWSSSYNPYTGNGREYRSSNNPYTGRSGSSETIYNPYTNSYRHSAEASNPYTGRSYSRSSSYSPSEGYSRSRYSYNSYTGASYSDSRSYNSYTGDGSSSHSYHNPYTGRSGWGQMTYNTYNNTYRHPAQTAAEQTWPQRERAPAIFGTWYMNGDRGAPCEIIPLKRVGRALFINEKGSRAKGVIREDRIFIPGWGDEGQGQEGRIRGDRIEWPSGSFWSRDVPDLSGTWFLNGDRDKRCRVVVDRTGNGALFINEKGSRARGEIQGDRVFIPDWGDDGQGQEGRIRGDRIEWPSGSFWSHSVPDLSGTWFLNCNRDKPCKIIQRKRDGRALFVNEKGSRARGTIRGNRVFIPDWGDDGQGQEGQVRGERIKWPGGSFWSRGFPSLSGTWYLNGNRDSPCKVIQDRDGCALFINEKGSRARGIIRGDRVFIPDWGDDGRGQEGRIRRKRIEWPGGSFWSR
jgi:hypothetical protein